MSARILSPGPVSPGDAPPVFPSQNRKNLSKPKKTSPGSSVNDDRPSGRSGIPPEIGLRPFPTRSVYRHRRPDRMWASASAAPKTLRPTGSAGLHSSRRPSLVEEKTKRRGNAGTKELERYGCSLKCVVNYGQFVCYKKRPSSRANDTCVSADCSSRGRIAGMSNHCSQFGGSVEVQ